MSISAVLILDLVFSILVFVSNIKMKSILDRQESGTNTNKIIKIIMNDYTKNFVFSLVIIIIFLLFFIIGFLSLLISF